MTKNIKRLFLASIGIIIVFFSVASQVSAIDSCTVTSPTGAIWYNKINTIEISCACPPGTTQLQNTFITKFYSTPVSFTGVDTTWRYTLPLGNRLESAKHGTYKVIGDCLNLNYTKIGNFTGTFDVHEISGQIALPTQSIPYEVYLTNTTSVEYKLFKDGTLVTLDSLATSGATLNFQAYLNNEATPEKKIADTNSASYDPAKQSWIIPAYQLNTVEGLTSENIYNLKVSLTYTEPPDITIPITNIEKNAVKTKKSLVLSLVPGSLPNVIDLTESTKKEIKLRVVILGSPAENLDITHFDVYMENKEGKRTGNLVDKEGFTYNEGDGYYVVPTNILKQEPGSYKLKISIWYPGIGEVVITATEIRFVLAFQGQIVDSNGNVVSASIVLKNNQTEIPIATGSTGKYDVPITADTYNIAMRFPDIWRVELKNVKISSNTIDPINYDYFAGDPKIDGLTVAKLVVVEFGLPFDEAYLEIPYNDALVDNEKNIKTFECTNWNFGKRRCIGEWKEISTIVNIVRDMVSFNTDRLSAFVIGERRGLWLDAALDKNDYFANERMTLTGKVVDTKSIALDGVEIHYNVEGTEIIGKATSGAGGIFTAILSAPPDGGTFNLIATAKKSPYVSYNMTYPFEVTKKKEVNLQVPETADITLDETNTVTITIFNTGQTELTNVKLNIAGLKDTWYTLEPNIFEIIPPGERKNVDLNIKVASEECETADCSKYYFVNVDFSSNEISEKTAFTAKIKRNNTVADDPAVSEEQPGFTMPDITGFVSVSSAGKTNMYVSFFFIVVAFMVITIKKRQRKTGNGGFGAPKMPRRSGIPSISAIKSRFSRRK
ncbi:MAG: hypothetical protein V1718_03915 [archaeon]